MPLDQLVEQTDPGGCHVVNLPSRIWVLGGSFDSEGCILSFRDAFWRLTIENGGVDWFIDLARPEDLAGWLEHSGYTDLLEFERDACYLARAIILFAESPGAHAEFGVIAIDESLLRRLAVVVQHKYRAGEARNSFLNLGPIRRVEKEGLLCVIGAEGVAAFSKIDYDAIIESVGGWLPVRHKSEKFQPLKSAHLFLLIADIIDVLLISTENDILSALAHFGVRLSPDALKKHLGMLKFLGLVSLNEQGIIRYWLGEDDDGPWIDYTSSNSKIPFDRARFKIKAREMLGDDIRLLSIYERVRK